MSHEGIRIVSGEEAQAGQPQAMFAFRRTRSRR